MTTQSTRLVAVALLTGFLSAASAVAAEFDPTQLREWIGSSCPRLVRDIRFGGASSKPSFAVGIEYDGSFFFVANNGNGRELWRTNGTFSSTQIVRDLTILGQPLTGDSNPNGMTVYNGILYFSADDGHHGQELFRSDGTFAGTYLLEDINVESFAPGYTDDSSPGDFFEYNGILYFSADDGIHGAELWRTDGTGPGTWMVKDLNTTPKQSDPNETDPSSPKGLVEVDGWLVLQANLGSDRGVWRSDGTGTNTTMLQGAINELNLSEALLYNGQLYFVGMTACLKVGLWTTNGTAAGTHQVSELGCGSFVFNPRTLMEYNGIMYFTPEIFGVQELWRSNGTDPGTYIVRDLGGNVSGLTVYNGSLLFAGGDVNNDSELWKTDGTEVGTVRVKDINAGPGSSTPRNLRVYQGLLYFTANGGELWRSNGSEVGTTLVEDAGVNGPIVEHNGLLYFSGDDGTRGKELWRSNGTAAGTYALADSNSSGDFLPTDFFKANGQLYYWADDGDAGEELWTLAYCPFSFLMNVTYATISLMTVQREVMRLRDESDIPDEGVVPILPVVYSAGVPVTSILRDLDANALPDRPPRTARSMDEILKNTETYYVYAPNDDDEQLQAVETAIELASELQQSRSVPVLLLLPLGGSGHELLQQFEVSGGRDFLRGECNNDGMVDISDAACALNWLFSTGGSTPGCMAALNVNGDAALDISDSISLLNYLFTGTGSLPAKPFPGCGPGTLAVDQVLGCLRPPKSCE